MPAKTVTETKHDKDFYLAAFEDQHLLPSAGKISGCYEAVMTAADDNDIPVFQRGGRGH